VGRQNLDGDRAVEACVSGAINLSHSTRADGGQDFIRTEMHAWLQCHDMYLRPERLSKR